MKLLKHALRLVAATFLIYASLFIHSSEYNKDKMVILCRNIGSRLTRIAIELTIKYYLIYYCFINKDTVYANRLAVDKKLQLHQRCSE